MKYLVLVFILVFSGCAFLPHRIHTKDGTNVVAPKDAEAPTTVSDGTTVETVVIPKGSKIKITENPAIPATQTTPAEPAKKVTELELSADTSKRTETKSTTVSLAPSRKPDTSVAIHAQDNEERRPLIWAALVFGVATGVLAYFRVLGAAKISAIASGACIAFYVILGHQELIMWVIGIGIVAAIGFVLYTEWRKGSLTAAANLATGTVKKLTQSVEEFTKDNPVLGKDLKQNYIAPNTDDAHKEIIEAAKSSIDTSYILMPPDPTHVVAVPVQAAVITPAPKT